MTLIINYRKLGAALRQSSLDAHGCIVSTESAWAFALENADLFDLGEDAALVLPDSMPLEVAETYLDGAQ